KLLVVPDNERAQAMARRFDAGESEYETDQKWWELVEEADAEVLRSGSGSQPPETLGGAAGPGETLGGAPGSPAPLSAPTAAPTPTRTRLVSLTRQYADELTGQRYEVEAFAVETDDPILKPRCPWAIRRTTAGPWEFYVVLNAAAFRSMTLTPL